MAATRVSNKTYISSQARLAGGLGLHLNTHLTNNVPRPTSHTLFQSKRSKPESEPPSPDWTWTQLCASVPVIPAPIIPSITVQPLHNPFHVPAGVASPSIRFADNVALSPPRRKVRRLSGSTMGVREVKEDWRTMVVPLTIYVVVVGVVFYLVFGSSERLFDD
ncbi:hypothetical protein BC829DRAFT_441719 [Chytridium lagenaria]|nr:hypothetical protein BC829DRAFT_441719 [Chytridium lagenaria]